MYREQLTRTLFLTAILSITSGWIFAATTKQENDTRPIERYALYVSSNDGGTSRETLKYAGSDAMRLAMTMSEIGGIKSGNSIILSDPSKADIDRAFKSVSSLIALGSAQSRRTEFIFYYSGHSDENSFLLGNETYAYSALKTALEKVPADVHVVMLDSCFSGNFVRSKGGSRQKSFLMDDATIVQGHAYLTSSSESEASQESDSIQASYFTQALVTGLRGAADSSGDGKVSLNELYYFAFNETLSKTERSSAGPQHPAYNITLVGSGDLVLTDIREAESVLYIPENDEGTYFFRNKKGILVSEINKIKGTEIALALPADEYVISVIMNRTTTLQGTFTLVRGQQLTLDSTTLGSVTRVQGRSRGDSETDENWTPISFSFFPGAVIPSTASTDNVHVAAGIFISDNKKIFGVQANSFGGNISGELRGIQASGFYNVCSGPIWGGQGSGFINIASGPVLGGQGAGFLNIVKADIKGVQSTGFMNIATGSFIGGQVGGFLNISSGTMTGIQSSGFLNIANEITGVQAGVINIATKEKGAPIGLINVILDGIISPAFYMDSDGNGYLQYQGGTDILYTSLFTGTSITAPYDEYAFFGLGVGTRKKINDSISFDFELTGKQFIDFSLLKNDATESEVKKIMVERAMPGIRIAANYNFYKHLGLFIAGSLDANFPGINNEGFSCGNRTDPLVIDRSILKIYPQVVFGIKF